MSQDLWYEIIDIGGTKRALAETMNLSIAEFDALGDVPGNAEKFDIKYEEYQQSLDPMWPIILDSRLWFYNQPDAFNVFLDVDAKEAAKRIFEAKRNTDAYDTVEQVQEINHSREKKNQQRYMKLYDVDLYDFDQYDLFMDTTSVSPIHVAQEIIEKYKDWKKVNNEL